MDSKRNAPNIVPEETDFIVRLLSYQEEEAHGSCDRCFQ